MNDTEIPGQRCTPMQLKLSPSDNRESEAMQDSGMGFDAAELAVPEPGN